MKPRSNTEILAWLSGSNWPLSRHWVSGRDVIFASSRKHRWEEGAKLSGCARALLDPQAQRVPGAAEYPGLGHRLLHHQRHRRHRRTARGGDLQRADALTL